MLRIIRYYNMRIIIEPDPDFDYDAFAEEWLTNEEDSFTSTRCLTGVAGLSRANTTRIVLATSFVGGMEQQQ